MPSISSKRSTLRTQLRQQRRALSNFEQTIAAVGLCEQFHLSGLSLKHKNIGLYFAADGEIDPELIAKKCQQQGLNIYLPVLNPLGKSSVRFAKVDKGTRFVENRFNIAEPDTHKTVAAMSLDLLLMPLVGFSRNGNRLGMGGGFYDKSLAFKQASKKLGPQLVGLAHALQQIDTVPSEPWDIKLDAVLTDSAIIRCC